MRSINLFLVFTLMIGWGVWAADLDLHKQINPAEPQMQSLGKVAPELLHKNHALASEKNGQVQDYFNIQSNQVDQGLTADLRNSHEIEKPSKSNHGVLKSILNGKAKADHVYLGSDGSQYKVNGMRVQAMPNKGQMSRDLDEKYVAYWTQSTELAFLYNTAYDANTWVGSVFNPAGDGLWPFKVVDFQFLNYGNTGSGWEAWQACGVNQDSSNYPTSTAGMQFLNYEGPVQDWAVLDMEPYDIYFDNANIAVHGLINWCASGGLCNAMGGDQTDPSVVDWDTNYVDLGSGYSWYTFTNLDWMHILTIEVMPDTGDLAYYFPFPIGSSVTHNTCAHAADSGFVNDYIPPSTYSGGDGVDAIYNIYPGADININITMTPTAWDGMIYLCSDYTDIENTTLAFANAGASGVAETITGFAVTAETDYYLIVDGVGASDCGEFTLSIAAAGLAPVNDTCPGATIASLPFSVSSNTYLAADDYQGTDCGFGADGADVVYQYTPATDEALSITLSPADFDGAVYVSTACPITGAGDCVDYADMAGEGGAETIGCFLASSSVTYYIFVDGYEPDDKGAYTLEVSATTPPTNDTCAGAEALVLDTDIESNTACATDDYEGTCTGASLTGGDLVYTYTPTEDEVLGIILDPTGFDAAVYIVTDCADPSMASCVGYTDEAGIGGEEQFCVDLTASTQYYIIVDGATSGGSFTLYALQTVRPDNDNCTTASVLDPISSGNFYYGSGYVSCGSNDYDPTAAGCTGTDLPGPDVVYSYTPTEDQTISLMATAYYSDWNIAAYITTDCSDLSGCVGVDDGGVGVSEFIHCFSMTSGTTYYIILDTPTEGLFGRYYFEFWPVMAQTNDTCLTAEAITELPFGVVGDTSCATDDYSPTLGTCFGTSADSGDLVYTYTTGASAETISVEYDPSFYTGSVYIVTDCSDVDNCVAGAYSDYPGAPVLLSCVTLDPSTTYYVIVDGSLGTAEQGMFTLYILETESPVNNDCASAEDITSFPAMIESDTWCADNTYVLGTDLMGHDLVYHMTPAATTHYDILYTPQDFDGALLMVEGTCPGGTIVDGYVSIPAGTTAAIPCVELTMGTDYYIIVDGDTSYDYGSFSLEINEVPGVPANDTCATAVSITSLPFTANDFTSCGTDDYDPTDLGCTGFAEPGPDVVYSYTPAEDQTIIVKLNSVFDSCVYILTDCGDPVGSCVIGADEYYGGTEEGFTVSLTSGTTYYIVVDSWDTYDAGDFTLEVTAMGSIPTTGPVGLGILIFALSALLGLRRFRRK